MKIIFLDIDGVLNGYNFLEYFGWGLVCRIKNEKLKDWYRRKTDVCGIHKRKVKRLAKIVKRTNAKVVLSSSWRFAYWNIPHKDKSGDLKKLYDLFSEYNIEVIGITGKTKEGKRDEEILTWVSSHNNIKNFVILDDENSFLKYFWDNPCFIQTSSVPNGKLIEGCWRENTGLKRKHINAAIKYLNNC